jgi:hypothetical protein
MAAPVTQISNREWFFSFSPPTLSKPASYNGNNSSWYDDNVGSIPTVGSKQNYIITHF